jgi:hypothetical protein
VDGNNLASTNLEAALNQLAIGLEDAGIANQ